MKRKAMVKNSRQYPAPHFLLVFSTIIILEQTDPYSAHVVKLMLSSDYLCLTFFQVHLLFIWKHP